jgi:hypothetical protein
VIRRLANIRPLARGVRGIVGGLLLWACSMGTASAQDWTGPGVSEVFSRDRNRFVRVVPGVPVDEATRGGSASKERFASAEFYLRAPDRSYRLAAQVTLAKTVAPVDFHVSDHGYLAVLDNWRSLGQGAVVSLYDPEGKPIRSYELSDLFDGEELAGLPRRVSSALRWRQGPSYVRPDQATLQVTVNSNAHFVFGMETGKFCYCEVQGNRQTMCRGAGLPRHWLPKGSIAVLR